MKNVFWNVVQWIKWQWCLWRSRRIVDAVKRRHPFCELLKAAWPTTGAGTLVSGYLQTGTVTTIVWGSELILSNIGGIATTANGRGIVTRFSERPLVNNIKLPQGDGLTAVRVQLIDGVQWDITVRDDTGFTVRPKPGNTVLIFDAAGFFPSSAGAGGSPSAFIATIEEASYDAAPGQPCEMNLTVTNLTLFTEAQVAT